MGEDRYHTALAFVLQWEGGYVDDPADPGGATNKGITQATYDAWRTDRGESVQPVRTITDSEVAGIYAGRYWQACGQGLPAPLDLVAFDSAVNCGVARTQEWLARAWHPTGDARLAADLLVGFREAHYRRLAERKPTMAKFLRGWLNRLTALKAAAGLGGT